jgi:hypothetical protein
VSESATLKACLHYLQMRGIECWRANVGAVKIPGSERYVRFGKKGMSDIQGYLDDGRALYVECKSATGKLRPEQVVFLERAERCGCKVVVARSVDDLIAAGL